MKRILFLVPLFAIILSGCAKDDPVQPETEESIPVSVIDASITSIDGKIDGWNKGANCTLEFYTRDIYTSYRHVIASAKIGSDGSFNLTELKVPPMQGNSLTAFQCYMVQMGEIIENKASCSDSSALICNENYFSVKDSSGKEIGILTRTADIQQPSDETKEKICYVSYVYAESDITVTGFIRYYPFFAGPGPRAPLATKSHNFKLRKGWNKVSRSLTLLKTGTRTDIVEFIYAGDEPGQAQWNFHKR